MPFFIPLQLGQSLITDQSMQQAGKEIEKKGYASISVESIHPRIYLTHHQTNVGENMKQGEKPTMSL